MTRITAIGEHTDTSCTNCGTAPTVGSTPRIVNDPLGVRAMVCGLERPCSNTLHEKHTRIPDQQRDSTDKRAESAHTHKNYFKNRSTITQAGSLIALWPVLRMTSPARTLLAHLTRAPDLQGQALWIATTSECIQECILSVS